MNVDQHPIQAERVDLKVNQINSVDCDLRQGEVENDITLLI